MSAGGDPGPQALLEELRRSEELVRTIAENSTQGLAMMDAQGLCTYANRAWLEMTGYSAQEIRSAPLHDLVHHHHPDGRPYPKHECPIDRALPEHFEIRAHPDLFFRKDGSSFPVLCAASPIFKDGRPVSTVIEIRDMTEPRRAEDRFRTAVEASTDILWTNDPSGRMTGPQPGWAAFTGQRQEAYEGYGWAAAVHPDDAGPTIAAWNAAVQSGTRFEFEHRVRRHDGVWRTFRIRALPVRAADGSVREWVGVHTDVTEQREAMDALRESDRRKDAFIATLAHELRNPLAPIRNAVELLHRVGGDDPRLARIRDIVGRQVGHMAALLDDLLDVARIERGQLRLDLAPCDLDRLARQTLEDYRGELEAAGCTPRFTGTGAPLPVLGDAVRLAQMIGNYLQNARRYAAGSPVQVRVAREGTWAVLQVLDQGPGMAPDLVPRLFRSFVQADQGLARSQGGLGLGLELTRGLATLHGGTVRAHSDGLGRGSMFEFRLPLHEAAAEPPAAALPGAGIAGTGRGVLLVEDHRDAAETLQLLLEAEGLQVQVAYEARTALALARERRPEVVVCDLGLPGMDGHQLAAELRRDPALAKVPLVALSGYADPDSRQQARAAGFDAHLAKPVDLEALLRVLQQLLPAGRG
jgi:PAS domain S-box-containing protein